MSLDISFADIAGWAGMGITLIVTIVKSNTYLIREIDRRIPFKEYDKRHRELEERIRRLELWAAKKSFGGGDGTENSVHRH